MSHGEEWAAFAAALSSTVTCYAAALDRVGDRLQERKRACDEVFKPVTRCRTLSTAHLPRRATSIPQAGAATAEKIISSCKPFGYAAHILISPQIDGCAVICLSRGTLVIEVAQEVLAAIVGDARPPLPAVPLLILHPAPENKMMDLSAASCATYKKIWSLQQ